MENIVTISNSDVTGLLTWNSIFDTIQQSLVAISTKVPKDGVDVTKNTLTSIQSPRSFTQMPSGGGALLCMPGYIQGLDLGSNKKESALSCKLLTIFNENANKQPPLSTIDGYITLFDTDNGKLKAILEADEITRWRTAAVSAVAAKALWGARSSAPRRILALVGAGSQGRIHAMAFINQFHFHEVRVWNRTASRSQDLVSDLVKLGVTALVSETIMNCVEGADVIVTTTSASQPILEDDWIKSNALIVAIGVGKQTELSLDIYKRAKVYVEDKESASRELSHLKIEGEIGEVILGKVARPDTEKITVFQSLGVGVEDAAVASLILVLKERQMQAKLQN